MIVPIPANRRPAVSRSSSAQVITFNRLGRMLLVQGPNPLRKLDDWQIHLLAIEYRMDQFGLAVGEWAFEPFEKWLLRKGYGR